MPDTQAQPPRHRWCVETLDPVAGEWAPGTRFLNRGHAVERYQAVSESFPTWNDGRPVQRRLVRETVTYTVEPATVPRPGSDEGHLAPADACQFHAPAGDPCAADGCGHAAGADCHPRSA